MWYIYPQTIIPTLKNIFVLLLLFQNRNRINKNAQEAIA